MSLRAAAISQLSLLVAGALASTSCSSSGTDALFSGSDAPDSGADEDGGSGGQGGEGGDGGSGGAGGDGGRGGQGGGGPHCAAGTWICEGSVARSCDGAGGFTETQNCAAQGKLCHEGLGCLSCVPGSSSCADGITKICNASGSGYVESVCDPLQGLTCAADGCKGACAPDMLGSSHLGCDFHPTVTPNYSTLSRWDFAVTIANPGQAPADVTITQGGDDIAQATVAPGVVEVVTLPWIDELLSPTGASRVIAHGAYRLRSTQPVGVHQHSPVQGKLVPPPEGCSGGCPSGSASGSLLLPAHVLGRDYTVQSWPSGNVGSAFYAITAIQDDTSVSLEGRGGVRAGAGVNDLGNGGVDLNAGDVLLVLAELASGNAKPDLGGSRVRANRPVQVIGGNACANVPSPETTYCDQIQEVMLPHAVWGSEHVVSRPVTVSAVTLPSALRLVAKQAGTVVSFNPPIQDPVTLGPSDPPLTIEQLPESVHITASAPIAVASFLHGATASALNASDPSQATVIPTEQFRRSYLFFANEGYDANLVGIVAKKGSKVSLDGAELPQDLFTTVGDSMYSVTWVQLGSAGSHTASSIEPFGLVSFGYVGNQSYMHPAGAELRDLTGP